MAGAGPHRSPLRRSMGGAPHAPDAGDSPSPRGGKSGGRRPAPELTARRHAQRARAAPDPRRGWLMRLEQFEHLVAAAAEVTGQDEFVVVGSQAILGAMDEPPASMLQSMEADVYPIRAPEAADLIDASLGDGSQFHAAFGYYAHGVGPETAKQPRGWEERLVRRAIPTRAGSHRTAVAWCLEIHDLVLLKLAAGRERDWDYAAEALEAGIVQPQVLLGRLPDLPVSDELRAPIERLLLSLVSA